MQNTIEQIVEETGNFSMPRLADAVWPLIESQPAITAVIEQLEASLGNSFRKLTYSILRNAFLIELVKVPKIETTKFRVRWFDQLNNDPRYCSFDECLLIAQDLLSTLPAWLANPSHAECMTL